MISQKRHLLLSRINRIGAFITAAEADEMIESYHHQYSDRPGSFLFDSLLFQQLLDVPGCEGIRVINGIHEEKYTLILAAVDHVNRNIPQPAPVAGHGTSLSYHPLQQIISEPATGIHTPHGARITREAGREMIATYLALQPGTIKSSLYGRELFEALLSIKGCNALRVCNALDNAGDHKVVLIPLDKDTNVIRNIMIGDTLYDPPYGNRGLACPPFCPPDFLIL